MTDISIEKMDNDISKANKIFDTELLIELVKSNPALYNTKPSSGTHMHRQNKLCNEIWKDISGVMEKEASECRSVWSSLRSAFLRHLKNLQYNAIETNIKKKKHWYLADKMEFLTEYMQFSQHDRRLYCKPKNQDINSSVDDNSTTFSNFDSKTGNSNDDFSTKSNDTSSEASLSNHEELDDNSNDCVIVSDTTAVNPRANFSEKNKYQVEQISTTDQNVLTPIQQISTTDQNILTPKQNGIEKALTEYPIFKLHQEPQTYPVFKLHQEPQKYPVFKLHQEPQKYPVFKLLQEEPPKVPVLKLNEDLPKFDVSKFHEEPPKVPDSKRLKIMSSEEAILTVTSRENNRSDNSKTREASTLMFFQSILFDLRHLSDRKLRLFKQDVLKDMNKYLDEDDDDDD